MKKVVSKATLLLLLLCNIITFSSCSDNEDKYKETVTMHYMPLVSGPIRYTAGKEGGGIEQILMYTLDEINATTAPLKKDTFEITRSGNTIEEAIEACNAIAIAKFSKSVPQMNEMVKVIEQKFYEKKAELQSEIDADYSQAKVILEDFGTNLYIAYRSVNSGLLIPCVVIKSGKVVTLKATGGTEY